MVLMFIFISLSMFEPEGILLRFKTQNINYIKNILLRYLCYEAIISSTWKYVVTSRGEKNNKNIKKKLLLCSWL